jgi:hypothetical protein
MSNTIIQVKRSSNTALAPNGSLASGQPGYSFLSDKLFLGNSAGTGVLTIGGQLYVDKISAAASANGSNTLVMRDLSGDFAARNITAANFTGLASLASALSPGRYIASAGGITGNVAFDGSVNINLGLTLSTTGVTAGPYGSASQIAAFVVDSQGRITSASNIAIAAGSTFTVQGNSGSDVITSGDFLNIVGNNGIVTAITANTGNTTVSVQLDSTVVRTVGDQTIAGVKTFSDAVVMSSGLTVSGTTTYVNTTDLHVGDNQVVLNADLGVGSAPTQDAGIVINRGNVNSNAAVYWDETNDWWTAVANNILSGASALGRIHTDSYANATALSTGTIDPARVAGSYTGITGLGTVTVGVWQGTNVAVAFGGTGRATFNLGGVIFGNTQGDLVATNVPVEGQILQGSSGGLPVFAMIDCGAF